MPCVARMKQQKLPIDGTEGSSYGNLPSKGIASVKHLLTSITSLLCFPQKGLSCQ